MLHTQHEGDEEDPDMIPLLSDSDRDPEFAPIVQLNSLPRAVDLQQIGTRIVLSAWVVIFGVLALVAVFLAARALSEIAALKAALNQHIHSPRPAPTPSPLLPKQQQQQPFHSEPCLLQCLTGGSWASLMIAWLPALDPNPGRSDLLCSRHPCTFSAERLVFIPL